MRIRINATAFFLTTALAIFPMSSIADSADSNGANVASPILLKASDIVFHPAPGFPKGAQIVILRGDLSKAEPYSMRFKFPDGFVIPSIGILLMNK